MNELIIMYLLINNYISMIEWLNTIESVLSSGYGKIFLLLLKKLG